MHIFHHTLRRALGTLAAALLIGAALAPLQGCDDKKSYADLLTDEAHMINRYLADQRVVNAVPADTVFQTGPDAPYYRLDQEGNVYMQVLNPGTPGLRVEDDQQIYFRFTRYNLYGYEDGKLPLGSGNADDLSAASAWFRFGNLYMSSSTQWGSGIQMPLYYLPIDCEVNLVVKSQYGMTSEIANVIPYLINVRYFKSQV